VDAFETAPQKMCDFFEKGIDKQQKKAIILIRKERTSKSSTTHRHRGVDLKFLGKPKRSWKK
jgi:hypothetical protein